MSVPSLFIMKENRLIIMTIQYIDGFYVNSPPPPSLPPVPLPPPSSLPPEVMPLAFFIVCKAGIADAFVQDSGILELNTLEYTFTEFLTWSEYDTWILNHCSGIEIGNVFYTVTFE